MKSAVATISGTRIGRGMLDVIFEQRDGRQAGRAMGRRFRREISSATI
jgi:hypothetical protein